MKAMKFIWEYFRNIYIYSFGILLLIFISLFVTSIGFFLGIPISQLHLIFSTTISLPIFYFYLRHVLGSNFIVPFISICVLIGATTFVSTKVASSFYDLSYDGQGYHQDAIVMLSQGWNPFYEKLYSEATPDLPRWKWINSYSKASETIEAVIYKGTGRIEQAKGLNILLLFMTFGFVLSFLLRINYINKLVTLLISLLLIWNPVNITQMFSFYLDGQLYLVLLSLIAVLGTIYITHKNYLIFPLVGLITLSWDMKLTGIMYSTFFLMFFMVLDWYSEKILLFFKKAQAYIIAVILAVFVIGFNPFITNIIHHGNPLYLMIGKDSTDFVISNTPKNFINKSPFERFAGSVFSRSNNARGENSNAVFKIPFTYNKEEIDTFIYPDNMTGGFGPLFSGVILVSMLLLFIGLREKHARKIKFIFYFFISTTLVSAAINPVSSYARYIPQFWILPASVALYSLMSKKMLVRTFGLVLVILIVINNFLISQKYFVYSHDASNRLSNELVLLKSGTDLKPKIVSFGAFRSNRIRFAEAGISFVENSILPCDKLNQKRILIKEIPESNINICN